MDLTNATTRNVLYTIDPFIYMLSIYENSAVLKLIHTKNFFKWVIHFPDIHGIYVDNIKTSMIIQLLENDNIYCDNINSWSRFPQSFSNQHETLHITFNIPCDYTGPIDLADWPYCGEIISYKNIVLDIVPKKFHYKIQIWDEKNYTLIIQEKITGLSGMLGTVRHIMDPRTFDKLGYIPFIDEASEIFYEVKRLVIRSNGKLKQKTRFGDNLECCEIFKKIHREIIKAYTDIINYKEYEIISTYKPEDIYGRGFLAGSLEIAGEAMIFRIRTILHGVKTQLLDSIIY
jgi:hypothetical protein